jgi:structural maintenance of chromosome 2
VVKKIEQELEEAKFAAKEKEILYNECVSTVSKLEKSIKEHDNNREGRLKNLEKQIKATKAQMKSASKDLKVGFNIADLLMDFLYGINLLFCIFYTF